VSRFVAKTSKAKRVKGNDSPVFARVAIGQSEGNQQLGNKGTTAPGLVSGEVIIKV
jgi:hypothetical protein